MRMIKEERLKLTGFTLKIFWHVQAVRPDMHPVSGKHLRMSIAGIDTLLITSRLRISGLEMIQPMSSYVACW